MRETTIERQTGETRIYASLCLDGEGNSTLSTGIGFFDHMLTLWSKHGLIDLTLKAEGDLCVDGHHTVEDCGIVLGQALAKCLGDKQGIRRYGTVFLPMDEALVMVSIDISGRPFLACDLELPAANLGGFETELVEEFLRALVVNAGLTLHVKQMAGKNTHHIIEAVFKALGRALDEATSLDPRVKGVPSTKGVLV
ncbi:imidazoleglycerol-phosphate dehydratase [Anaerosporomusa subterranea]|uniref:Imidazoleglycerol-phosphate dehydratase n=1 Tax=Anaerosporomusa subterranea TaxID=1794912 RepID=A0A154BMP5_ANASB|nr:imidazoleglycerol-phosphate dehydratase HisB [Anaerosporomusa subterranea]KYZ75196.1 imidazoleglycerol-phosphate dehydratase [Anaerosporomusa subterranea]